MTSIERAKLRRITDRIIGMRLRVRRVALGFSQGNLGYEIGVSYQQVQKYENGTDRMAASTLLEFCSILRVPITYFFDGLQGSASRKDRLKSIR